MKLAAMIKCNFSTTDSEEVSPDSFLPSLLSNDEILSRLLSAVFTDFCADIFRHSRSVISCSGLVSRIVRQSGYTRL